MLVSGRGTNLAAVLDAVADGRLAGITPAVVISNRREIPALEIARHYGVPVQTFRRAEFPSGDERDAAIGAALTAAGAELALLAGYDQMLRPTYFTAFRGRTLNIHPALLPAHGGHGMMGIAVHRAVLAADETETGVTIHEVTDVLDGGPILAQVRVPVRPGETADALEARLLPIEHALLVRTLAALTASPHRTDRPA